MAIEYPGPNIILGAGRFFIDRLVEQSDGTFIPSGAETYIGDTVGGSLSATVERQTIFSGDGAIAKKLIDKVTQVDRVLGITPQDASLDNMALFLIATAPAAIAEVANASIYATAFQVPAGVTMREYFQLGVDPASPVACPVFEDAAEGTPWGIALKFADSAADAATGTALATSDYVLDRESGRIGFTAAGIGKVAGKFVKPTFTGAKIAAMRQVKVDDESKQVRVAVRYLEDPDDGVNGRNIYVPQTSVAPAGEAALKSRDTPQQFPLTLAIEKSARSGIDEVYIDGMGT